MSSFWETARDRLKANERVYIVLVVDHSVHSPGTTGARMAVLESGSAVGTVGGGVMELDIIQSARELLTEGAEATPHLRKLFHRKEGEGEKSGLICAGFQTNLYMTLYGSDHLDALETIVAAERNDSPTILEISPAGLRVTPSATEASQVQFSLAQSGDSWTYRESVRNLSRVAILGGGHCGLALSRLMHDLGYHVTIFDTRPRVPTMLENDFTDEKHIVNDFTDAAAMVHLPEHTNVVVMTTALDSDVRALIGAAKRPFPFVGVMGSRAKIAAIRKALLEEGISEDWIERLAAPVGLPVGSNTPDEIAVSVAGQLLQVRSALRETGQTQSP